MRPSRRTFWALAASLALHAIALGWLVVRARPFEPSPEPPEPYVVEIVRMPLPEAPPEIIRQGKDSAVRKGSGKTRAAAIDVGTRGDDTPVAESSPRSPQPPPKISTVVPDASFVLPERRGDPSGDPRDARRGHTLRNDGSGMSPEQRAELSALEAEVLVDGWMKDDLAELRVRNGLVDPWFTQMRNGLEKGLADAPREAWPLENNIARDFLNHYRDGLERYGATGNPYGERRVANALPEVMSPLARAIERDPGMLEFQQKLHRAHTLRDFANGEFAGGMVALVEIRQASDGKLLDVAIVRPSGNPNFDEYVLATAPESVAALPRTPEALAKGSPDGIRSLWAFRGSITYKRKLREFNLRDPADAAYLAAAGFTSLLTGNFDEVTGDVDVVDLRHPRFKSRVKLLRLY